MHEVCLNYEVAEFQPWKLTTPELGSITYFYLDCLLDPSRPLLLATNILPPPQSLFECLCHRHNGIILPPGRPPSLSHHTKKKHLPPFSHPSFSKADSSSPLSNPATSVGFLLPLLPRCFQNIFQRGFQLLLGSRLQPPRLEQLPPSLISRLLFTYLKYWPKGHPLRYRHLPLVDIILTCPAPPSSKSVSRGFSVLSRYSHRHLCIPFFSLFCRLTVQKLIVHL